MPVEKSAVPDRSEYRMKSSCVRSYISPKPRQNRRTIQHTGKSGTLFMGRPGFEPGTNRLKAEYSTIELATLDFPFFFKITQISPSGKGYLQKFCRDPYKSFHLGPRFQGEQVFAGIRCGDRSRVRGNRNLCP